MQYIFRAYDKLEKNFIIFDLMKPLDYQVDKVYFEKNIVGTFDQFCNIQDDKEVDLFTNDIIEWQYSIGEKFKGTIVFVDHTIQGDLDSDQRHVGFMVKFDDETLTDIPDNFVIVSNALRQMYE